MNKDEVEARREKLISEYNNVTSEFLRKVKEKGLDNNKKDLDEENQKKKIVSEHQGNRVSNSNELNKKTVLEKDER